MKKAFIFSLAMAFGLCILAEVTAHGPAKGATSIVEKHCTSCHGLERALKKRRSKSGWESVVERMINYGLEITPSEKKDLLDFLIKNYKRSG